MSDEAPRKWLVGDGPDGVTVREVRPASGDTADDVARVELAEWVAEIALALKLGAHWLGEDGSDADTLREAASRLTTYEKALEAAEARADRAQRAADQGWDLFYEYADDPDAILRARAATTGEGSDTAGEGESG